MSNSPLTTYKRITNNKTVLASKNLNRITIHCYVGQVTAKQGVDYFATTDRQASSNYVVGYDGSIGLSVDEKDRAWTSSSAANDKQSITIETACDLKSPYTVKPAAYNALINLVTDICKRYGKTKVVWINDKTKALAYQPKKNEVLLTVHRWFASTDCPGEYLFNRQGTIAAAVNDRLNGKQEEEEIVTQAEFNKMMENYLNALAAKGSTWEQEAMNWAKNEGLLKGNEKGQLMPKSFVTRGELATILKRYDEDHE